jgi:hypothetical protein
MQFRKIIANYVLLSGIILNYMFLFSVILHYCAIDVVKMGLVGDHYTCKCASSESPLDK